MKGDEHTQEPKVQGILEKIGRRISGWLDQQAKKFTLSQFRIAMVVFSILFASVCLSLIFSSVGQQNFSPPFSIQKITQPPLTRTDSVRRQQGIILKRLMDRLEKTPQPKTLFDSLLHTRSTSQKGDSLTRQKPDFLH